MSFNPVFLVFFSVDWSAIYSGYQTNNQGQLDNRNGRSLVRLFQDGHFYHERSDGVLRIYKCDIVGFVPACSCSLRPDHSDGRCNVRNRTDYLWLCADWVTIKAFHENTIEMRTGRLSAISHTSIIVIKSFQVQYLSIIHLRSERDVSFKYLRYFLKGSKIVHNKIILRKNKPRTNWFFFQRHLFWIQLIIIKLLTD